MLGTRQGSRVTTTFVAIMPRPMSAMAPMACAVPSCDARKPYRRLPKGNPPMQSARMPMARPRISGLESSRMLVAWSVINSP